MGLHAKTVRLITTAVEILTELHPMTVRQVYYQLVSRQVIKNTRSQYTAASKALDGEGSKVTFAKTKTHKNRTVPINDDLADVLRRLQAQTLREGGPFVGMRNNINRKWRRIVAAAGVAPITIHDLRRTYITRLVGADVDMSTVKRLAGHKRTETTDKYYIGKDEGRDRDAVSRLKRDVG